MKFRNKKTGEIREFGWTVINSSLLTAQQRKRIYFVGKLQEDGTYKKVEIQQPQDKGILLKDILESNVDNKYNISEQHTVAMMKHNKNFKTRDLNGKTTALTASYYKQPLDGNYILVEPICVASRGRNIVDGKRQDIKGAKTEQRLEPNLNFKTNTLTSVQKDNLILEPIRLGHFNKGGQADRIYSVEGKSVCLSANGGGGGACTGLYKINLLDGDYRIRKLTPNECARLQGFPDNYTNCVSNTQAYKGYGNSFTVPVIKHILGHFINNFNN